MANLLYWSMGKWWKRHSRKCSLHFSLVFDLWSLHDLWSFPDELERQLINSCATVVFTDDIHLKKTLIAVKNCERVKVISNLLSIIINWLLDGNRSSHYGGTRYTWGNRWLGYRNRISSYREYRQGYGWIHKRWEYRYCSWCWFYGHSSLFIWNNWNSKGSYDESSRIQYNDETIDWVSGWIKNKDEIR